LIYFPNKNEVRLYDSENITIATVKKGGTEIESIEAPIPHGYGMLPVVRFTALDDGSSQIEDIAECNKSLFNMDALLREELHNQTFTQWIVSGIGPEEMQAAETTLAGRKLWCINKSEIKVERIGSDVSQAESIRDTIDGDIKEIYRLSGLHNPDVIQKAESGRALHIRWNDVEITAAAIADHSEEVENRIIDLWITGMGGNEVVEYSDYPETFDSEDLGIALKATLDTLMSDMPFVLKKEQVKEYAGKAFPNRMSDIVEELDTELDKMGKQNEENRNNIAAMNAANNDNPEIQPIDKGATE
jgi:hypothetical protein